MKSAEQKAKKVPAIRFAGFEDEWVEKKLSELATMHARIGWQNLRTSEFLDAGDYMLVTGTDFEDGKISFSTCHYVAKERYDQDKNIQIRNGSILITKDGTLGKVAFVQNLTKPATLNAGVFNVELKNKKETDEKYVFQYLKAPFLMDYVGNKATGGTIKHLNQNILVDFPVVSPKKEEQQKIGSFFSNIDSLISLEQKKYDKLTQVKKSMLEKMFPKEGATVPEIRFAGFTGDWEKDEFSNIITVHPFKPYLAEPHIGGKIEVIQQGNDPIAGYANGKPFEDYKNVTLFGDHTVSLYKARNPFFVASDGLKILSSKKTSPNFFYHMLDRFKPIPEGYKRHFMILLERECYYPKEKTEQNLISSYLNSLDSLISLQQRKLEKLKNIKKSLLEKMFV